MEEDLQEGGTDRREQRDKVVSLGLAVVLAALLVAAGWLWWSQRDDGSPAGALSSARTAVTTFFDMDHETIEEDLDAMAALSTGEFAKAYGAEREKLAEQVTTKELVITSTIVEQGTAVEYLHEDHAQVLVAVDATTEDSGGAAETAHYRMRVVLDRTDDTWLVSGLEQVG
ncbi:hypothetical protein L615_001300000710 [Nocardioides sp. J9]|uniref:hypothetical protein n=1 Tax=unclassified Nocardioides TaxID=2615069 RepID=UPI00048AA1C3|nr:MULTISPECIES: hypothetical protein [unclassified Nocardioides]TWH02707.1 hypothetical protein L615_001300000710 [Nocardioides sp. J9]